MLLHNLSNALDISISTRLLSSIQKLLPYNTLCFALGKLDTYLLLYFLPALYIFERKGALHTPHPKKKKKKKKWCLYCKTTILQIYCGKSQFFLEFFRIYLPKYKIKILCVFTVA